MSQAIEVKIPDIGDFKNVPVIEVLVKPGDTVKAEDPLVTLESDKATIDVPSPGPGTVKAVNVKVGDKVSEGTLVLVLEGNGAAPVKAAAKPESTKPPTAALPTGSAKPPAVAPSPRPGVAGSANVATGSTAAAPQTIEVKIPDIGDFENVPVIEVMVRPGDTVKAEDPLVTLESDKATIDVPSPSAGKIKDVKVKVGDKVSEGTLVLVLESSAAGKAAVAQGTTAVASATPASAPPYKTSEPVAIGAAATGTPAAPSTEEPTTRPPIEPMPTSQQWIAQAGAHRAHASPSVRQFARELGVDVARVKGSGPKGRILKEDVQSYVKGVLSGAGAPSAPPAAGGVGLDLLPWPKIDFAKFGAVEVKPLSRIKKISGANLWRNWVMIPHVTQFDEADITDLEEFRVEINKEHEKNGIKVTILAFLIKAAVTALKSFPDFNASLDGDNLVHKRYFHIGFAADTPGGLVVPVIRDADKKTVLEIARESSALAKKARDGKLAPAEMQGGCFSISSLGGIGGTAFTPIINAPEVAILGVSKSELKPKWNGAEFKPRLMLPMSLSYDHRVVDGATAARFITHMSQVLADMRRAML